MSNPALNYSPPLNTLARCAKHIAVRKRISASSHPSYLTSAPCPLPSNLSPEP